MKVLPCDDKCNYCISAGDHADTPSYDGHSVTNDEGNQKYNSWTLEFGRTQRKGNNNSKSPKRTWRVQDVND
jgi:hypothetical protein